MSEFDYKDLSTTNHGNQRWYICDEETVLPSITTILGGTQPPEKAKKLADWAAAIGQANAKAHTKKACIRGENVHLMIEHLLGGQEINVPEASDLDRKLFTSMKLPLRKISKVYGLEVALFSKVLGVAGRTDCVGEFAELPSIIDFKTSGRPKNDKEVEDYWLQCTFYALAHNEMYGTDIMQGVIIMGVENGLPLVWKKDLYEFISPLATRIEEFYTKMSKNI